MRKTKEKQIFKKVFESYKTLKIRDKLWTLLKIWDLQALMLR